MVNKVTKDEVLSCSKLASFTDDFVKWCEEKLQKDALIEEYVYTPNDVRPFNTKNEVLDTCNRALQFEDVRGDEEERPLAFEMGDIQEPYILNRMADALGLYDYDDSITEAYIHPTLKFEGSPDGMGQATENDEEALVIHPQHEGKVKVFTPNGLPLSVKGRGVLEAKYQHYGKPREDCPLTLGRLQAQGLCECADYDWYAVGVQYGNSCTHVFVYPRHELFKVWLEEVVNDFNDRLAEMRWYEADDKDDAAFIYPEAMDKMLDLTESDTDELIDKRTMLANMVASNQDSINEIDTILMRRMEDHKYAYTTKHEITWPSRNYKAKPEQTKVIPASVARTVRSKTLKIKEVTTND